ncbi:YceD family protein [Zhongshania sp. BJYM1]|uniref:YceD family protein n=1 Tax=Zhongshania aquatica TaxID=2965069 RepID=UPI0022B2B756|nr:YceD family protein [Marortus sp. BJYM1]
MQRQPLPKFVDARKFVSSGMEIHAYRQVDGLDRFVAGLANNSGSVDVDLRFFRDEQGFKCINGSAVAHAEVICQRCLNPMPICIEAEFNLAIVWTDEQAKALPKSLDPLILEEESLVLADLLQDELIINTPFVSFHDEECRDFIPEPEPEVVVRDEEEGDKPFAILGQLKPRD